MTVAEQRVLDKYLLEAHLNGMELSKKDQDYLQTLLSNIEKEKGNFR